MTKPETELDLYKKTLAQEKQHNIQLSEELLRTKLRPSYETAANALVEMTARWRKETDSHSKYKMMYELSQQTVTRLRSELCEQKEVSNKLARRILMSLLP